jgi:hypothetical protein
MKIPQCACTVSRLIAVAILAAFVVCGAWGRTVAACLTVNTDGPFSSSDRLLSDALQTGDASAQILASISPLPPRQPLALLIPDALVSGPQLQAALSSISWPHQVSLIPVKNGDAEKTLSNLSHTRFGAALLFRIDPSVPKSGSRHVGRLTIIPISK